MKSPSAASMSTTHHRGPCLPGLPALKPIKARPAAAKQPNQFSIRFGIYLALFLCAGVLTFQAFYTQSSSVNPIHTTYSCLPLEPGFSNPNLTTCSFEQLVLWNGEVYIVDPYSTEHTPPRVNTDWFVPGETLPIHHIHSIDQLPGLQNDTQILHYPKAVIAGLAFYHNFYHAFAEYAPAIHSMVCRLWGDCHYRENDPLQVIMSNKPSIAPEHLERPMNPSAMQCVTQEPVLHLWHSKLQEKLIVLEKALVGFGPECRADQFHCLPWEEHRPPQQEVMHKWRNRVAKCIGFDAERTAPVDPIRILVVDRPYETGRHFINVDTVIEHLRQKYGHVAQVKLVYLEGTSMQEQAALYNDASIIIWNHGAAMANLIYAPVGSVAVQVVFMPTPQALFAWPDELVRDLPHNVTLKHLVNKNPDRLLLRAAWVRLGDRYQILTKQEKLAVWEKKQCPTAHGDHIKVECDEFWVKVAHELELDLQQLEDMLTPVIDGFLQQKGGESSKR